MSGVLYLLLYLHITKLYNGYEDGFYDQASSTIGDG